MSRGDDELAAKITGDLMKDQMGLGEHQRHDEGLTPIDALPDSQYRIQDLSVFSTRRRIRTVEPAPVETPSQIARIARQFRAELRRFGIPQNQKHSIQPRR
jgi:hypothetical protein